MSKRQLAGRVLVGALILLAAWFSSLGPEVRETIVEVLFGL